MSTEPLTPDAVRALIAEAETHLANVHNCSILKDRHDDLIERLTAALTATLPREDADLDAIESRAAWAGSYSTDGVQAAAECFRIAREDVPALLARVRTAEAERDQARLVAGGAYVDGLRDGQARAVEKAGSLNPEELDALVAAAWRAHHIDLWGDDLDPRDTGKAESGPIRAALLAVLALLPATAEPVWEYGVDYSVQRAGRVENGWTGWSTRDLADAQDTASRMLDGKLLRRRAPGQPEAVPPTELTTAPECGNDSHHGYGTGYCGDCTKEAGK